MPEVRGVNPSNIIRDPQNLEDMQNKLFQQEARNVEKVFEKYKVETIEDLLESARSSIKERFNRSKTPLELVGGPVVKEPTSPEILRLRASLEHDVSHIGQGILGH